MAQRGRVSRPRGWLLALAALLAAAVACEAPSYSDPDVAVLVENPGVVA